MYFAFVDTTAGAVHSIYESDALETDITPPEGCICLPIPASIVTKNAILAVPMDESPGFKIVDNETKLAEFRDLALPHVRETRNQLMAACDWRVMPDSPLTPEKRAEWVAYRQALRDFTKTSEVIDPQWPAMPQ